MAAYPIKAGDPASVLKVMQSLFPNIQFVLDAKAKRLMVLALPAEQEAILRGDGKDRRRRTDGVAGKAYDVPGAPD